MFGCGRQSPNKVAISKEMATQTIANVNRNLLSVEQNDVIPVRDVTYELGSASFRWKDLWAQTIHGNVIPMGLSPNDLVSTTGTGALETTISKTSPVFSGTVGAAGVNVVGTGNASVNVTSGTGFLSYVQFGSASVSGASTLGCDNTGGKLEAFWLQSLPPGTANADMKLYPSTSSTPALQLHNADGSVAVPTAIASTSPTTGSLTVAGGVGVAGVVSTGGGVSLPTSNAVLTTYKTGSPGLNWTGAATVGSTASFTRVGNLVTFSCGPVDIITTATNVFQTTIPDASYFPAINGLSMPIIVMGAGGLLGTGAVSIGSDGSVAVAADVGFDNFPSGNECGWLPWSVSYIGL